MKKNRMMRLASVLLVCVLLTTSVISGTFAKYTSSATATDSARVAKWSILVGKGDAQRDIAKTDVTTFEFELFNTVLDTVDGKKERNVAEGVDTVIIAPGTKGAFDIVLENASEVTATYAIDYTVNNAGVPIEYSIDDGKNWSTEITDVTATQINMGASVTIHVEWRWAFEGKDSANYTNSQTDVTDTALGIADQLATPTVTATITATQVD